ncbi:uncharacterized protein LOC109792816 [Cajanus cajan]|uniref:uncharacterized protein LOC109792816 n=1 Tax=Cajanus cajan TaxID=3821 RepID=UPI00098DC804|nr:uncharacterized protein LOC109792816 [Cajanus cajan]
METPLPFGWKPFNIDRYDGIADLDEHIDLYVTQVNLYTNEDAILCRVFSTSLKGEALAWYTFNIDRYDGIADLDEHIDLYVTQYATSQPHHITSATLASLRQGEDKPLRAFMERFASTSVKIRNLNPEVALHAMLMALKLGPFVDSLCRRPPPYMDELHARAAGYIQMEEHTAFRDQVHGKAQAKPDHSHKDKMKVTNDNQFKKATRANKGGRHSRNSADKSKHSQYHKNYGHTTEECHTLRDRIEELVQGGTSDNTSNGNKVTDEATTDEDEDEAKVPGHVRTNPPLLSKTLTVRCRPR